MGSRESERVEGAGQDSCHAPALGPADLVPMRPPAPCYGDETRPEPTLIDNVSLLSIDDPSTDH